MNDLVIKHFEGKTSSTLIDKLEGWRKLCPTPAMQELVDILEERLTSPSTPMKGTIYFVQAHDGEPVKIGFSRDVKRRINAIQKSNGSRLVTLGLMDGDLDVEKTIHTKFANLRLHGEWFLPGQELLNFIESTKGSLKSKRGMACQAR